MNGNFTFHNPTRLHFGENAMEFLKGELAAFGPTVQLCYGGGGMQRVGKEFAKSFGDTAKVLSTKAFSGPSIKSSVAALETFADER